MSITAQTREQRNDQRPSVGIITLPGSYNYGNRLQCYAVCEVFKSLGCTPIVLNRHSSRIKRLAKRALGREWRTVEERMDPDRAKRFSQFNKLIPQRYVNRPYSALKKKYSFFSVGSDQTWNPKYMARDASWYFLSFVPNGQRIALAPSIGICRLDVKEEEMLRRGVMSFPSLSVREQRGSELIKKVSGRDAVTLCDPTFMLTEDTWRAVSRDDLTPSGPYVFTYLLGDVQREVKDIVTSTSLNGAIPVVRLSDRDLLGEVKAGPSEFLSLIDNASHVITDSFHAAVFSSIFQTPLTIVKRGGGHDIFSRIDNLVRILDIEHKVYGTHNFDLSKAGDYEGAPEAIGRERQRFIAYLEGCLDRQIPGWREVADA